MLALAKTRMFRAVAGGALACCALPGLCRAERQYEVTELPHPGAGLNYVVWVGEDGRTSGSFMRPVSGDNLLVATSAGVCYTFDGEQFTFLTDPQAHCYAYAGNGKGEIAGMLLLNNRASIAGLAPGVAYVNREGEFIRLAASVPDGRVFVNSSATAMNELGEVTGTLIWQNAANGSLGIDGWVHSGGTLRTLPGLGGNSTRPFAINALGDVAGDSLTPPGDQQEQHAIVIHRDGTLTDLGTLGAAWATASGINIRGQVVGSSALSSDPRAPRIAFFHNGTVMMPIHIDGSAGTTAAAINDEGEVVGSYSKVDEKGLTVSRALYYTAGQAVDLNTLVVDAPPGAYLIHASIIYNDGRIVAIGGVEGDGATHTFLLTPVEDGDPTTLTRRWRRR